MALAGLWVVLAFAGALAQLQDPGITDPSIVGGSRTSIKDVPWQVGLFDTSDEIFCGGSIIAPNVILTAQHCFHGGRRLRNVGAGRALVSDYLRDRSLLIPVKSVVLFPQYDPVSEGSLGKDAAIVILERDLVYSDTIQPVSMAVMKDEQDGVIAVKRQATISGWGTTAYLANKYPDQLRLAKVTILTSRMAQRTGMGYIYPDQMLAGQLHGRGKADTCQGDSGGPLTVDSRKGKILAGITSWGIGCADGVHPGVYSRVSHFSSWAQAIVARSLPASIERPLYNRTIHVAENLNTGAFEGRSYNLLIPRGLRSVTFTLTTGPAAWSATLLVMTGQPDNTCAGFGTPLTCTIVAPMEGVYAVVVTAGSTPLEDARVDTVFESSNAPSTVYFERQNVTVKPRARVNFIGFPILPDEPFHVSVHKIAGAWQPRVAVAAGMSPALPPGGTDLEVDRTFKQTSGSVMVTGDGEFPISVSIRITYVSFETPQVIAQRAEYLGDLVQPSADLVYALPFALKVGSEFGVRFFMESGSAGLAVRFGATEDWRCYPLPGHVTFCSGVVPQRSQMVRVTLQGEARNFQLVLSYDKA